jgi:hypothetical protein
MALRVSGVLLSHYEMKTFDQDHSIMSDFQSRRRRAMPSGARYLGAMTVALAAQRLRHERVSRGTLPIAGWT